MSNPNQQANFVENAMTMQKALETAYSDWNKEKQNNSMSSNSEIMTNDQNKLEKGIN